MATKTKTFDAKNDLAWGEAKRVETKRGPRDLRTAAATPEFWDAWKSEKETLRSQGFSCGKSKGQWQVQWWARLGDDDQQDRTESLEASRSTDDDIEVPSPEGLEYLPYQRAGIAYALQRKHVLLGDEMGLGKTIQAIGVINARPKKQKVLIVCPASLRLNWEKELRKWLVVPHSIHVVDGGTKTAFPSSDVADIVVINYDVVGKHSETIRSITWDVLVVDEAHYLKNAKAKRTQEVLGAKVDRKALVHHNGIRSLISLFLTGTPLVNRPNELWTLAQRLDPNGLGRSWWNFHTTYCALKKTKFGLDISGHSNLSQLQELLREKFLVRRLSKDVLELGTLRRQVIELPVNGSARVVSDEAEAFHAHQQNLIELRHRVEIAKASDNKEDYQDAVEELRGGSAAAFADIARQRKQVALAKVPVVADHVASAAEQGPVILFCHHKDVVSQYESELTGRELRVAKITGTVPMRERQAIVDRFQAGQIDVLIGNIQAAGVGLTLTRSHHVIFAELPWTPAELSQAEKRAHRIGQESPVLVQHLVLEGSLDSHMANTLVRKQNVLDAALDDEVSQEGLDAPVLPISFEEQPATVNYVPSQITKDSESITTREISAVHAALKYLSARCDGANALDGQGFSAVDTKFGKQLAFSLTLSPRQAAIGRKIVNKYRRQLSADMISATGIKAKGG